MQFYFLFEEQKTHVSVYSLVRRQEADCICAPVRQPRRRSAVTCRRLRTAVRAECSCIIPRMRFCAQPPDALTDIRSGGMIQTVSESADCRTLRRRLTAGARRLIRKREKSRQKKREKIPPRAESFFCAQTCCTAGLRNGILHLYTFNVFFV